MCTRNAGISNEGWCSGDSFCPEMGPLDYYDKDSNIKWISGMPNHDGFVEEEDTVV